MIMPTLMVLLLWLVAGLCLLVWWQVADRVWDALTVLRDRRNRPETAGSGGRSHNHTIRDGSH